MYSVTMHYMYICLLAPLHTFTLYIIYTLYVLLHSFPSEIPHKVCNYSLDNSSSESPSEESDYRSEDGSDVEDGGGLESLIDGKSLEEVIFLMVKPYLLDFVMIILILWDLI